MSKFIILFTGIFILFAGCVYDVPSVKVPPSSTTIQTDQRVTMTPEEARRLYNEQVRQRTVNYPFSDEPPVVQTLPKSRSSNSGNRIIKQSNSSSQGSLKCGSVPRYCKEMVSCAQAKAALKCGNSRLDRDGDGIPCENICGG